MRSILGAAIFVGPVLVLAGVVWWVCAGIDGWFVANPGAGGVLGWSLVVALVLTFFALPAAAWGVAARMWVVRLREHERLEATLPVIMAPVRARPQLPNEAVGGELVEAPVPARAKIGP